MNFRSIAIAAFSVLAFAVHVAWAEAHVAWAEGASVAGPQDSVAAQEPCAEVRDQAHAAGPSALRYRGDGVVDARPSAGSPVRRAAVSERARREARTLDVSARLLP